MKEDVRELAAVLVGCDVSDILAVRLRDVGLSVVWGFGQKKVFPVDALPAARLEVRRAQMIEAAPVEIAPTNDVGGLRALFPERLVKVLVRAGFSSPGAVQRATDDELRAVGGVGPRTLADIREYLLYSQR